LRAVVYDRYGPPDVLRLVDVPRPTPGPAQVLVEVAATAVNLSDWECLVGSPAYVRMAGLRSPARPTLGSDISGRVVEVGSEVTRFQIGDEVYGKGPMGGFADFAVISEKNLAREPEGLSHVEASTIPESGSIALQGVAAATPGSRVLINGAGGGTGPFAIQLAKKAGAHVTGVDNAGKLDFMRSVGADEVVDYRATDFTRLEPFDLVLDLVARRSVFAYHRSLRRGGRYWCVGGTARALLRVLTVGSLLGRLTDRKLGLLMVRMDPAHFTPMAEMCRAGDVRIHIDSTYPLEGVADALARVGEGKALGKVVVEIA
jgi:NADPH:quinone reductase-like Zn-dependent oxidoreductase